MVPEIWCAMDGQTDGWKKWNIEVGAAPENLKKPTLSIVNAGPHRYRVSVLSTTCGGCHPKGFIVAS